MQETSTLSSLGSPAKIEDPRSPLHQARRRELREFCRLKNIPFDQADPATFLREKIVKAGYDYLAINEQGQVLPDPQIVEPVRDVLDESIEKLSWGVLKSKCKEIGIPLNNKQKRPELEKLLKDTLRGNVA